MNSSNPSSPPNNPPLPHVVDRRRNRLFRLLFGPDNSTLPIGETLSESRLQEAAIRLYHYLGPRYSPDRIYQYLSAGWLGVTLKDTEEAKRFCWVLASSLDQLSTCCEKALVVPSIPAAPHWACLLIQDVHYAERSENGSLYQVHYLVWGGPFVGRSSSCLWSVRKLHFLWWQFLGQCRQLYMEDAKQLYGMIALAYLAGEGTDSLQPRSWHVPANFCRYNRQLTKRRDPLRGRRCPFNFQHSCYTCRMGVDQCLLAVRTKSCRMIYCKRCKRKAYCDPLFGDDVCVRCARVDTQCHS